MITINKPWIVENQRDLRHLLKFCETGKGVRRSNSLCLYWRCPLAVPHSDSNTYFPLPKQLDHTMTKAPEAGERGKTKTQHMAPVKQRYTRSGLCTRDGGSRSLTYSLAQSYGSSLPSCVCVYMLVRGSVACVNAVIMLQCGSSGLVFSMWRWRWIHVIFLVMISEWLSWDVIVIYRWSCWLSIWREIDRCSSVCLECRYNINDRVYTSVCGQKHQLTRKWHHDIILVLEDHFFIVSDDYKGFQPLLLSRQPALGIEKTSPIRLQNLIFDMRVLWGRS